MYLHFESLVILYLSYIVSKSGSLVIKCNFKFSRHAFTTSKRILTEAYFIFLRLLLNVILNQFSSSWDAPLKNPQTVYLYRVFWRAYGAKVPEKLDTSETSVVLTGLEDDVRYECVVKAANDVGE